MADRLGPWLLAAARAPDDGSDGGRGKPAPAPGAGGPAPDTGNDTPDERPANPAPPPPAPPAPPGRGDEQDPGADDGGDDGGDDTPGDGGRPAPGRTVEIWRYYTAEDAMVCPVCAPLNYTEWEGDAGPWPPLHAGCRCERWVLRTEVRGYGRRPIVLPPGGASKAPKKPKLPPSESPERARRDRPDAPQIAGRPAGGFGRGGL